MLHNTMYQTCGVQTWPSAAQTCTPGTAPSWATEPYPQPHLSTRTKTCSKFCTTHHSLYRHREACLTFPCCKLKLEGNYLSMTQQTLVQNPSQASSPGALFWPILLGYALCSYHAGCCTTPCIRHVEYTPGLLQYRPVLLALHHLGPQNTTLNHSCQREPRHAQSFAPHSTAFKETGRHA